MKQKPEHATITLEHTYQAPIELVFCEFADPVARARWSTSSGDVLIYDQAEFREGGRDLFRCGPKNDPRFHGVTFYHLIVPNECVISTETLEADGQPLAISLNTMEFESAGEGTHLKVTVQMLSLAGPGMIAGYEAGNKGALENFAGHLSDHL
jgi:uncharacterized protein YndB with AHSA1/START domain